MAVRRIRVPDISASRQTVDLDGRLYQLVFRYNPRMDSWFMDIETDTGEPLVQTIRVVLDLPLLFGKNTDDRLPPGDLIALCPTERSRRDPGRNAFRTDRCIQLYYIEADT